MYPAGIPRYGDLSRMSFSPNMPGISTGNIMIDMLVSSLMGNRNFSAIPGQGQGVYDAYLTQQRSKQFIQSMQHGFGSALMFQKMGGLSTGSSGQMATMLFGQPDGLMNTPFFRAMNGGNPVKQMMALNAGMTGQTMNMAYGSPANATFSQLRAAFEGQNDVMFSKKVFTQADFDKANTSAGQRLAKSLLSSTAGTGLFGDAIIKDKEGNNTFDFEKIKKNPKKYAKLAQESGNQAVIDAYNEVFNATEGINELRKKINTKILDKVDFSATRGFESQDLATALLTSKDLGMTFSKNRFSKNPTATNEDIRETEAKATKNIAILMDAMQDVSGTPEAKGLISELNNVVGAGQLDLTNSQQTKDVEKLLREFKGAARAAGISIDTVMGIHKASQELASRLPQLQSRSGLGLVSSNISAIQSTSALTSALGPDWARSQGGQQQILETRSAANIMAADENFIKEAAGWSAMIDSTDMSDPDKKELQTLLRKSLNSGELVNPQKRIEMTQLLAEKTGKSVNQVLMHGKNAADQQTGFANWTEEEMRGEAAWDIPGSVIAGTLADADLMAEASQADPEKWEKFKKLVATGVPVPKALSKSGLGEMGDGGISTIFKGDVYRLNFTEQVVKTHPDSPYAKQIAELKASGNAYAKDSAEFAERGGALKAQFSSVIMQEVLGGNLPNGLDSFAKIFTNPDSKVRGDKLLTAARNVADEGTTMSVKEAMLEAAGGLNVSSSDDLRKNLKLMGYKDEAIDLKVKQHERLNNSEDWENLDQVGSLSMSEILNASKSDAAWDRSSAAAQGFDKSAVNRAAKFLNETGMSSNADKYGRKSWNQSKQGMAINAGVDAASRIAADEQIKNITTKTDASFEQQLNDLNKTKDPYVDELTKAMTTLGVDVKNEGGVISVDTAKALELGWKPEDANNPDSPEVKAAKEKIQKNAVLTSAHAHIDSISSSALSAGDSAEKMMISEFGRLSKQIGDSSGSISSAISDLVNMLGKFNQV